MCGTDEGQAQHLTGGLSSNRGAYIPRYLTLAGVKIEPLGTIGGRRRPKSRPETAPMAITTARPSVPPLRKSRRE